MSSFVVNINWNQNRVSRIVNFSKSSFSDWPQIGNINVWERLPFFNNWDNLNTSWKHNSQRIFKLASSTRELCAWAQNNKTDRLVLMRSLKKIMKTKHQVKKEGLFLRSDTFEHFAMTHVGSSQQRGEIQSTSAKTTTSATAIHDINLYNSVDN